jgi:hypothetical protein
VLLFRNFLASSFRFGLYGRIVRLFISQRLHTPESPLKRGLDGEIPS